MLFCSFWLSSNAFSNRSIIKHNQLKVHSKTALMASTSDSLTLFGHPGTRSPLVNWGAYEVGLDIKMGDLAQNPHPFGQIPCLTDKDDVLVFESGAILLYLHDLTREKWSNFEAASIISWITWANASLDPICFLETPDGKVYDTGLKKPNKRIGQLDQIFSERKFLIGDKFSLSDVAVASYLLYVLQFFPGTDLSRWPNLIRYMKDCASRPAYAQAFGESKQANLINQLNADPKSKMFGIF